MAESTAPAPELPPLPLRVASILAGIVGVITTVTGAAMAVAARGRADALLNGIFGLATGAGLCIASYLVWRRRKLGGWIVLAAFVLPSIVVRLGSGEWHPPPLLLVLAALTLLSTWPMLR